MIFPRLNSWCQYVPMLYLHPVNVLTRLISISKLVHKITTLLLTLQSLAIHILFWCVPISSLRRRHLHAQKHILDFRMDVLNLKFRVCYSARIRWVEECWINAELTVYLLLVPTVLIMNEYRINTVFPLNDHKCCLSMIVCKMKFIYNIYIIWWDDIFFRIK